MLKHSLITTAFASIYLLLYVVLLQFEAANNIASVLFFFSPLVLLFLAYSILRYGTYNGKEFTETDEWGYQDKHAEK